MHAVEHESPWLAAQTTRIKLGTFVTVLPWNDPARVAESFSVLDHMSGGRAILGLGRGLGQKEFVGFRVPMGESRRRFTEYSEALPNESFQLKDALKALPALAGAFSGGTNSGSGQAMIGRR